MTEAEWMTSCNFPELLAVFRKNTGERKKFLFACACCRCVWHLLPDDCRRLVDTVERYADGLASASELVSLMDGFDPHEQNFQALAGGSQAAQAVSSLGWRWRFRRFAASYGDLMVDQVSRSAAEALAKSVPWADARQAEAELLRDIVGIPFRPALPLPRFVLAWNDGTVFRIAQGTYEEWASGRLPILADALLDAGCDNEELIGHCRSAGPHVRGCWAVDLVLGKS
jgi:hypothetical protein